MKTTTSRASEIIMVTDSLSIISHFYSEEPELRDLMLKHAFQVRAKARQILEFSGLELDCEVISTGALLHDIGIIRCHAPGILCNGELPYIAHGVAGAEMLRDYGQAHGMDLECFARICERHTGSGLTEADIRNQDLPLPHQDFLPETMEEILICLADKFFSKSGEMKEKTLSSVRRSMEKFGEASLDRFDQMCHLFCVDETLPMLSEE